MPDRGVSVMSYFSFGFRGPTDRCTKHAKNVATESLDIAASWVAWV